MARKENGLGLLTINAFWRAIRMSWLRRLSTSKSTWEILHRAETKPCTFNPTTSKMDELIKSQKYDNKPGLKGYLRLTVNLQEEHHLFPSE